MKVYPKSSFNDQGWSGDYVDYSAAMLVSWVGHKTTTLVHDYVFVLFTKPCGFHLCMLISSHYKESIVWVFIHQNNKLCICLKIILSMLVDI